MVGGVNTALAPICTSVVAEAYPAAAAVMVAEPRLTPVTWGCVAGEVCPAGIETVAGDTVAFPVSLLDRETLTPPPGAGADRLNTKELD